jgi:hypothetical protein
VTIFPHASILFSQKLTNIGRFFKILGIGVQICGTGEIQKVRKVSNSLIYRASLSPIPACKASRNLYSLIQLTKHSPQIPVHSAPKGLESWKYDGG